MQERTEPDDIKECLERNTERMSQYLKAYLVHKDYQKNPGNTYFNKKITRLRDEVKSGLNANDLSTSCGNLIQKLEELRDAKTGISWKHRKRDQADKPDIIIRDARWCNKEQLRGTEALEIQYLNAIRGACDVIDLDDGVTDRAQAKQALYDQAQRYMNSFHQQFEAVPLANTEELLRRSEANRFELAKIAKLLENSGVKKAAKKLNMAIEYQTFNDKQANFATISTVQGATIVESEVGIRGLTQEQKAQYENPNQQEWFTSAKSFEQKLIDKKYAAKIVEGNHIIPNKLTHIPGLRNAFEKTTAIYQGGQLENIHSVKHMASPASGAKKGFMALARANINALKSLGTVILNSLKSMGDITRNERHFSKQEQELSGQDGYFVGTAINSGRVYYDSNDFRGIDKLLDDIKDDTDLKDLADKVRAAKNKASGFQGSFSKTATLQLSNALSTLGHAMSEQQKANVCIFCRSGIDRTGVAVQLQSSIAVSGRLGISPDAAAQALLPSSHFAIVQGGAIAGGGYSGAYGAKQYTNSDNELSKAVIDKMYEPTANDNKVVSGVWNAITRLVLGTGTWAGVKDAWHGKSSLVSKVSNESSPVKAQTVPQQQGKGFSPSPSPRLVNTQSLRK